MVVDDDADVRQGLSAILGSAGHKVSTCASGLEALKSLGIQPNDDSVDLPDLMVLDIMMPKSDGYVVGTAIRGNTRTRGIPILVVSALPQMSRLFTATLPVDGFLTKPFDPKRLIDVVAKLIGKRPA